MIKSLLWIAIGGSAGSLIRFMISIYIQQQVQWKFWSTFTVNAVGSLLLGGIIGYAIHTGQQQAAWVLGLSVGFCGGFTTFSTFSYDVFDMLQKGDWSQAFLYIILSVLSGTILFAIGYFLTHKGIA